MVPAVTQRRIKVGSDGRGHFAAFDRDTSAITITAHGSGQEVFTWVDVTGKLEPTHRQLKALLQEMEWDCCKKREQT